MKAGAPPKSKARPESDQSLKLARVTSANAALVTALQLHAHQIDSMDSIAASLREASRCTLACPRAIMRGTRAIGFLMYDLPDASSPSVVRIYRFMIDAQEQGKGYGRSALRLAISEIADLPDVRRVEICYMPDNEPARTLYQSAGFIEDGSDEDGEMIAHLDLP